MGSFAGHLVAPCSDDGCSCCCVLIQLQSAGADGGTVDTAAELAAESDRVRPWLGLWGLCKLFTSLCLQSLGNSWESAAISQESAGVIDLSL